LLPWRERSDVEAAQADLDAPPAPPRSACQALVHRVEQDLVDLRGVGQDVGRIVVDGDHELDVSPRFVHRSRLVTSWMTSASETARLMVSRRRLKARISA